MKCFIKKILREGLEDLSEFERLLFDEGKKFYRKLSFKKIPNKTTGVITTRVFLNYPKNRGSFSVGSFKNHIIDIKIKKTIDWLGNKLIKNLNYSKTTSSVYFNYNNKNFRMSNHRKNSFNGIDILINWDTSPQEIVNHFKV
jgi:hypothetical protein